MLRWFLWFLCPGLWYISLDGAKIWCSTTIIRTFKKYFCMISHRKSWIFIPSFLLFEQMPCFSVLAKSVYDTFKVSNTSITNTYNLAHPCQSWTSLIKPPTPTATHVHFPLSHTQWDALPQHICPGINFPPNVHFCHIWMHHTHTPFLNNIDGLGSGVTPPPAPFSINHHVRLACKFG